ncbi:hypothetical protein IWQ57_003119 [Coemansia nantahalensis]|uniref:Uncharacterized protein n=1 Tax=Coemansia nantahalensis TaxID=2789366 RepID=A0ACC1JXG5_9FUNG|nr:hypothetical protein IWQ57_003119 [Coemansia nantahalensis]
MKLSRVSPAAALAMSLLGTASAGLSGCPQNLAFQITNVAQFGKITFAFDACTVDKVRGGYRAGVANFNTADGSAWKVIQEYRRTTKGDDEFTPFDSVLQKSDTRRTSSGRGDGSGSSNNDDEANSLDGFCDAWEAAAISRTFRSAQGSVFTDNYFDRSQSLADNLGLTLSISQAQLYDAAISHGTGTQKGGLLGMIQTTNKNVTANVPGVTGSLLTINGFKVDEIKWLQMFLNVRSAYTKAPGAKSSIDTYNSMIHNMMAAYTNSDNKDRTVFQWAGKINVLSNVAGMGNVSCENSYLDASANGPTTCNGSPATGQNSVAGQCNIAPAAAGVALAAVALAVALVM